MAELIPGLDIPPAQLDLEVFDLVKRTSGPRKHREKSSRGRAVLYLRVSTKGQVTTDYDPEGISLPAQRAACEQKARQLGLDVVGEYVEPGKSGREMSKRVRFNEMLDRIKNEGDVTHVIVYKLSRLNRNRYDDADVMRVLDAHAVGLISATEGIDNTPVGKLMHGVLASFNQYRSEEDGADIRYKLGEKAKRGGTISRAPIGYVNYGERLEDREVRTVKLDEARAAFISLAFELYATGEYTFQDLSDELFDRGLRTRATISKSAGQLMPQQIGRMLRDTYYLGYVTYGGEQIPGRHPALVSLQLFDRVQEIISARDLVDERRRQHTHYLKGTLYCGRCHDQNEAGRMILQRAAGRGGVYMYFFCRHKNRRESPCASRYTPADRIEDAIVRYYRALRFTPAFITEMRDQLASVIERQQSTTIQLERELNRELASVNSKERNLLDLAADGTLPRETIRERVGELRFERARISERLEVIHEDLSVSVAYLEAALALLEEPGELYANATDEHRKLLNQALFEKILVDDEEITDVVYNEPFAELVGAERAYLGSLESSESDRVDVALQILRNSKAAPEGGLTCIRSEALLRGIVHVVGSSSNHMVDPRGFEPLTSSMRTRRATNCAKGPNCLS